MSLREGHPRSDLDAIIAAALRAVDPAVLVGAFGFTQLLDRIRNNTLRVVAAGKAAAPMFRGFTRRYHVEPENAVVAEPSTAGHPLPNTVSVAAGARALELAAAGRPGDYLIVLLSGGASAMLAAPARGLTLDDKRSTTAAMLERGADIAALNTVRKHISSIKGGRLAAAHRGDTVTLVLSDVVGDDATTIASGPAVADPTTFADALRTLDALGVRGRVPTAVRLHLERGARGEEPETPKPGDPLLARSTTGVIGSRHHAMRGAADEAESRGYGVHLLDDAIVGEARTAASKYIDTLEEIATGVDRATCVISSGETTVRVVGSGKGGRNQEFALAAADRLATLGRANVVLASLGTDGIDGPTDAAGAVVDSTTVARLGEQGVPSVSAVLDRNDSYTAFAALGDLIITGPTGTNVGDLQISLIVPR